MIGHHEISSYFSREMEGAFSGSIVAFPEKYYTQIYPFMQEIEITPVIEARTPDALRADYFVYPVWEDTSFMEDRVSISLVDSIYLRGVEVYRVYAPLPRE